jgi:hypothetical protein
LTVVAFYSNGHISRSIASYHSDIHIEKSGEYDRVTLENSFHYTTEVGFPELPVYVQSFVVPLDAKLNGVTVNGINRQKLEGVFYVYPAQPPMPAVQYNADDFTPPNPAVYRSSKPYPGKQAEIISDDVYLGYRIVTVQLYPVEYIPLTRELYLCSFNFSLNYSANTKQANDNGFEMQTQSLYRYEKNKKNVKFCVENPEAVEGYDTKVQYVVEGDSIIYDFSPSLNTKGDGTRSQTVSVLNEQIPDYIIITNNALKPAFQTLANWKTKKGIFSVIVTTEEIDANYLGSDIQEKIRNYLIEANNKWGAGLYVLLGGDINIVPARIVYGYDEMLFPADRYYYTSDTWSIHHDNVFSSNNTLSIINILGRIPVSNTQEVTVYTNKVIKYEKANGLGDLNYLKNHLYADAYMNDRYGYLSDFAVKRIKNSGNTYSSSWINHRFICDNADCSGDPAWYTPSGSDCGNGNTNGDIELNRNNFLSCLNTGANLGNGKFHFIYHMDHSSAVGIGTSSKDKNESIRRTEADNLTNGTSYQILMSGGCNPANFAFDCFGKHYIMNSNGGGVAFIGNTDSGWTNEYYQLDYFLDPLHTSTNYPSMGRYDIGSAYNNVSINTRSDNWRLHLLGEPEMQVWTNVPQTFNVTLPSSVTTGQSSLAVNISGLNLPQDETALICLQKGSEVYETRMVSGNGSYTFPVSPATTGAISVTVTAHNYFPVEKSVPVTKGTAPNPVIESVNFVDNGSSGSIGNSNGQNDAGETVRLQVELKNTGGSATKNNLTVTLKSASGYITKLDSMLVLSPIATDSTVILQFRYQIDKDAPEILSNAANPVRFVLELKDPSTFGQREYIIKRPFNIDVFATDLQQRNKEIVSNAGNVVTFNMELQNVGKAPSTGLTATLKVNSVIVGSNSYPVIGRFDTKTAANVFQFTIPQGQTVTTVPLKLEVANTYGKMWSFDFTLAKPDTVNGLDFVAGVDNIVVKWDTLSGSGGYNIYRCDADDNDIAVGNYIKLNTVPVSHNFFKDNHELAPLTKYYYKVAAVSQSGMKGDAVRVLAWTSYPSTGFFPMQIDMSGASRIVTSIITDDVNNDGYSEIFTHFDGGDISEKGYIVGLDYEGRDLFDIDHNITTNSGFAQFNASMQAPVATGDLFANGSKQIISASREMKYRNNIITCHVAKDDNGDGLPDVLWQNQTTYTYSKGAIVSNLDNSSDGSMEIVLKGDLNSGAQTGKDIQVFSNTGILLYTFGNRSNYSALAVADLDEDGDMEIIAGDPNGVFIWHHNGTPYSTNPIFSRQGYYFHSSPVICDLNDDGQKEIVITASKHTTSAQDGPTNGIIYVLKPNGTVLQGWPTQSFPIASRDISQEVSVGDLYNDGNLYVVTFAQDYAKVWDKSGNIISSTYLRGVYGTQNVPVLADVDGDDIADILAESQTEGKLYAIKPDGTNVVGFPLHADIKFSRASPCVTDLNNSGKNTIIAGSGNKVYAWETNGYPSRIEWGMERFNAQNTGEYFKHCSETVITANTVWNSNMEVCGDIVVQSGTLTLNSGCTLKMNSETKIIVQPGAKLAVNGGTITNMYPNVLWQGIVVQGSTTTPQHEQTQGSVILTNATI